MQVSEKQAVNQLIEFVKNTADDDDLASMFSKYLADGSVTVGNSDPHENGDRM